MNKLSPLHDDEKFTNRFWREIALILIAAFGIAVGLVGIAVFSYYGSKYGW